MGSLRPSGPNVTSDSNDPSVLGD